MIDWFWHKVAGIEFKLTTGLDLTVIVCVTIAEVHAAAGLITTIPIV